MNAHGNTVEIDHLLRKRIGGNANFSQCEFETGLRGYKPSSEFSPSKPWTNVITEKVHLKKELGSIEKSRLGRKAQKILSSEVAGDYATLPNEALRKYSDKFRDKNTNLIRHLLKSVGKGLNEMLWETNLGNP